MYIRDELIINESKIVNRNKIYAPDELKNANCNFDVLALIQHYGGSTRILDVSTNALIALFFAVAEEKNSNQDGYVYIFSNNRNRKEEILNSNSDEVAIKSALSQLSYEQKVFLSEIFSDKKDSEEDIECYIKDNGINDKVRAIVDLYSIVERNIKNFRRKIRIKDLFGINFVQPIKIDRRITQQASSFIIFGLENICESKKITEEMLKKDIKIKEKQMEIKQLEQEEFDNITKLFQLDKELEGIRRSIEFDNLKKSVQDEADSLMKSVEIMYSPENFLGYTKVNQGLARIEIKSKYKQQIINELEMIGIDESIIFPDFAHKAKIINDRYIDI